MGSSTGRTVAFTEVITNGAQEKATGSSTTETVKVFAEGFGVEGCWRGKECISSLGE